MWRVRLSTYRCLEWIFSRSWQDAETHILNNLDMCEQALWPLLPAGTPPPESDAEAYRLWREQLQQALVCALDEVQVTFACIGHPSGTTVTIVIQVCALTIGV